VTKLWTSTLVMQLVDEGKVDLDKPVRTYLPEFRVADESAARRLGLRPPEHFPLPAPTRRSCVAKPRWPWTGRRYRHE
jgi:hypothetical protein